MKPWQEIMILVGVGLLVGFVNGFLGAGAGILLVPMLIFVLKMPIKTAHATAVVIIFPICVVSGIVYLSKGLVDGAVLWKVVLGSVAGGVIGTFLLKKLKPEWLTLIFSVVMVAAGIYIVI